MIRDRNGAPLAISTPVDSVWAHPGTFAESRDRWAQLARVLRVSTGEISRSYNRHSGREFMYLKRHVTPQVANKVKELAIPGVYLQREYRRYYPTGPVSGHVIGFTNIDDHGQEGLELVYDPLLRAIPGKKRVLKDRLGNIVESVENIRLPVPGKDITLSLDRRIQYLAYRELKAAVKQHKASSGSVVVLDAKTGEILAMVNEPGFNPNNRSGLRSRLFRNRSVTDVLEPGSTIKPFTIALGLESGRFKPATLINTSPGLFKVGQKTIRDAHNYGYLSVAGVLEKSSNVGATKIALAMNKKELWKQYSDVGFGSLTGSELPGEVAGKLRAPGRWVNIDHAVISFGYGLSVTPVQLARAYTAIANDGVLLPVTTLHHDGNEIKGRRVFSVTTARHVRAMLERAAGKHGTGAAAQVQHYRIAGKTGTVHKIISGSYSEKNYISLFAGMAPASDPRLVMVVTVDDPRGHEYFGGRVAAPVFSRVMSGAMRLLNIAPDGMGLPNDRYIVQQKNRDTVRPG